MYVRASDWEFKSTECQFLAQILWNYFSNAGVMRDGDNVGEIMSAVQGVDTKFSQIEERLRQVELLTVQLRMVNR